MPAAWGPAAPDHRGEPRSAELSLERFVRTVRERWLILALAVVAAVNAAVLYVATVHPVYEAEADLLVAPVTDPSLDGLSLIRSSSDPSRDVETAARLVSTIDVADRVRRRLGSPESSRRLLTQMRADPVAGSDIVAVTARGPTPQDAARLADAFAHAVVADRTARLHAQLAATIPRLQALIDSVPAASRSQTPESLGARIAALQSLQGGYDPTLQVQSSASEPTAPVSPRRLRGIAAGLIVGLMLGIGAAFAADALDPRLRRESQLEQLFDLPILTRVPWVRQRRRRVPLLPSHEHPYLLSAYRLLDDALNALGDGNARSTVFTAASRGQGATTSALHYAWVLAAADERVMLVDGDVRRPAIGRVTRARSSPYLTRALAGERPLSDALVSVELNGMVLEVLAPDDRSGEPPPDERARLAFGKRLVTDVLNLGDRLVIDAPPLTEGPDALPLARAVNRVVLIARLGSTRLAALRDLRDTLLRHGVRPAGIIVVGTRLTRVQIDSERRRLLRRSDELPAGVGADDGHGEPADGVPPILPEPPLAPQRAEWTSRPTVGPER
jgi:capsular polysaccharide biosynthesis protein/cellulose biosynthesis protein BcsQ